MNDGNFGQFRSDRLKHFSFIPVFNTQADEFGSNIPKKKKIYKCVWNLFYYQTKWWSKIKDFDSQT